MVLKATKTLDELEKRILALGQRWSCLQGSKSPAAKYATLRCVLTQQVRRSVVDDLGNDATSKLDHRNDAGICWKSHPLGASRRTSRRGIRRRTRGARRARPVFAATVDPLFAAKVYPLFAAKVYPLFAAKVDPVFATTVGHVFSTRFKLVRDGRADIVFSFWGHDHRHELVQIYNTVLNPQV